MIDLWIQALETVRDSEEIRVVVISGKGRGFCAGGDIKTMAKGNGFLDTEAKEGPFSALDRKNSLWKKIHRVPLTMKEIDKPIIASLHGFAFGAGFDMALACDIRIAAKSTKISESYLKVGIVPGDGAAWLLPRFVGVDQTLDLLWTGKVLTADEAKEMGLITHVVDDAQLTTFVSDYAEKLTKGPQAAIALTKRAVYQGLDMSFKTSLDMISSSMAIVSELDDFHEGVRAINERRSPHFK
jgi:enoyl-CoA hydratase/carnithine racemase